MRRTLKMLASAFAVAAVTTIAISPVFAGSATPIGQWQTSKGDARYKVTYCSSNLLCAKLTWLRDDARTAANLAMLNSYVVRARPVADNNWSGEVVYEGRTYQGTVTLISNNSMRVKSCSGMLCQNFEFSRI